ncbi:uncharacterized protein [Argopecten irradians]|uniref:uncharacterized protein n=1 Tax=Argopecten irradians TaxID=31199 RepID=UPI00371FE4F6
MKIVNVGFGMLVALVALPFRGEFVKAQTSSQTVTPSSEGFTQTLSSQPYESTVISPQPDNTGSTSELVSITIGTGTSPVILRMVSSEQSIQSTISVTGSVKPSTSVTDDISTGVNRPTPHLVEMTSSVLPSQSQQPIPGDTVNTLVTSSQELSSSLVLASSVAILPTASQSDMVQTTAIPSFMVPVDQTISVVSSPETVSSTKTITHLLPSSIMFDSETEVTTLAYDIGSASASNVKSLVVPSSSSFSSSISSVNYPSVSSPVIVHSSGTSISEQMYSESSTTQSPSVSPSVSFSLRSTNEFSPSRSVNVQYSSHMAFSTVASSMLSISTRESLNIQTSMLEQESSSDVLPPKVTSEVLSITSPISIETSHSLPIQSSQPAASLAISSTVDQMVSVSSSDISVQPTIMTLTDSQTTSVLVQSSSVQMSSASLIPDIVSSQPTTVQTPSRSTTLALSTSLSPTYSATPNVPTLKARNVSFEIEFNGVCNPLVQRKIVLEIFWEELVIILAKTLRIENSAIKPKDIACRPIRISFVITETTRTNTTQILKDLIDDGGLTFEIPVRVGGSESKYQYEALSVKQVPLDYDISGTPDLYEIGLNKVDIIVIIVACCVSFILICIGCCICLREYYIRKRSRSFDLSDIVNFNLKLEDYTLTKIPRNKPFYSDNSVKMQSFTRKNGQQTKSLLEQEEQCNCDDVNVMKEVKVRMNSHSDGIVIGVTATSIPDVVTNHQRSHDDHTDQSKEILFESESSPTNCVDNPIYFADDDRFTAV